MYVVERIASKVGELQDNPFNVFPNITIESGPFIRAQQSNCVTAKCN